MSWTFLGADELKKIRQMVKMGKLLDAEKILLEGEPSPAVLDALRKISSIRAKEAKKKSDWVSVVNHLEGYNTYAKTHRAHCKQMVNAEPPEHTPTDKKLLQEAKDKLLTGKTNEQLASGV